MKKIAFMMLAFVLIGSTAMAQGNSKGCKKADADTRAKQLTEKMVSEYSLNEAQQKKLAEVNLAWAKSMDTKCVDKKGDKDKTVSKEEKELLEKLKNSANFKPQPGKSEKSFFERIKEYFE